MPNSLSDFGLIGLAVMGQNLARNVASRGYKTSVYNRTTEKMIDFIQAHGHDHLVGQETLEAFVNSIATPRKIMIMVKAGHPVDLVIQSLIPFLDKGDIIIDGGNSLYTDTIRREKELAKQGLNFFGCGVSGGEEGALKGPSLMPGGNFDVWEDLKPIFESIAAKDFHGGACVTYLSPNGAGHYVKMVHNGIEYAIMQMISEAYQLLKDIYSLSAPEIADIFVGYQHGRLGSFLFEISIPILRKKDEETNNYLIDIILDKAGQKGTGRWTAVESYKLGAEASTIAAAVNGRVSSSMKIAREEYATLYKKSIQKNNLPLDEFIIKLEQALYAAILVAYAQGFDLIQKAADEYDWKFDFSEVVRIWEGGCIIRAKVLQTMSAAFKKNPNKKLLQITEIQHDIQNAWRDWREIVASGVRAGVPLYCLGSALTSFESLVSARTSANMIQGLRDFFGAHTYQRIDKEGVFHTHWE